MRIYSYTLSLTLTLAHFYAYAYSILNTLQSTPDGPKEGPHLDAKFWIMPKWDDNTGSVNSKYCADAARQAAIERQQSSVFYFKAYDDMPDNTREVVAAIRKTYEQKRVYFSKSPNGKMNTLSHAEAMQRHARQIWMDACTSGNEDTPAFVDRASGKRVAAVGDWGERVGGDSPSPTIADMQGDKKSYRCVDRGGKSGYAKVGPTLRENFQSWRMYTFKKSENQKQMGRDLRGALAQEREIDNSSGREGNIPFFE